MKTENVILDLSFGFALQILGLYKKLIEAKEFVLSKELLKSATSIGANIEEANAAISKREFIAKMSIASKEARECRYWLRLLDKSKIADLDYSDYLHLIEHIINVLTKIVKTSQESIKSN